MLDKKTFKTLKILNSMCEEGIYKVIELDCLLSKFPKGYKINKVALDQNLDYLKAGQYVDVKYSENNTYCLCVLPKGRMVLEDNTRETKTYKKLNKTIVLTTLLCGAMSFLGSFLAIILFL